MCTMDYPKPEGRIHKYTILGLSQVDNISILWWWAS